MSILDKLRHHARGHKDVTEKGLDTGARTADEKTGGKYGEQIGKGRDSATEYLTGEKPEQPKAEQPKGTPTETDPSTTDTGEPGQI